ncbi:hypothetical protein AM233_21970 [Bacillus sp. FJAT-22058]|nr:hypothetical protein AM233_21970 [Bacillus sp. FJAT-22058]
MGTLISPPGTRFPRAVGEPPRLGPAGSPLDTLFPQDSRTFRSNQLEFYKRNIVGKLALLLQFVFSLAVPSIFRQKEFRIALVPNQNFKSKLDYSSCFFTIILNRLKKCATLLPNNWLAETPKALASRRLGKQSAERKRISEISWNFFLEGL